MHFFPRGATSRWLLLKSFLPTLICLTLLLPKTGNGAAGITINFIKENPNYNASQIYVAFCGQSNPDMLAGKIITGGALSLGTNYSLADLASGVQLTKFIGGRICIALGKPFESLERKSDFNPNFNNPSLPDFNRRWDKVEITYNAADPHSVANISATDFFSVRLKVNAYSGARLVSTLTWQQAIATLFHGAGVLSGFSHEAVCSNNQTGVPTEGFTPGSTVNVVRIIAPSTVPAAVVNPYRSFQDYIDHVRKNAIVTDIQGSFNDTTSYKFTALIDSAGALVMNGTVTTNSVPQSHVIVIRGSELDRGIYTADPLCNIDGVDSHPGNTPIGTAVRDVLAGFNLGFIDSKEQNPNAPGKTFGQSASYQWYHPPLPEKYAFSGAQPDKPFYNQYAAYLAPLTDAYGFPYSDLTKATFAALKPGEIDRMDITVLPDK